MKQITTQRLFFLFSSIGLFIRAGCINAKKKQVTGAPLISEPMEVRRTF